MKPEIEAHLRSLIDFPSPPTVAMRIIELARDPDIELAKVAMALSLDSALTTKILRIANSPLYAQRRKSESLRQALVVLGLNAALTLALSFSLVKALRAKTSNGISHPLYWRRALLCATAGRAIADAMHHRMSEEISLAALLQDVGMLALDQAVPDLYEAGSAIQQDHVALAAMEHARLAADHADVGGFLMRLWNLPERLYLAVEQSHDAAHLHAPDGACVFERCVALSGPVADLFLEAAEPHRFAAAAHSAERALGLDRAAFGRVLATVGSMIPETEALFECEPLSCAHPELIVEQAREVLMLRNLKAFDEIHALRSVAQSSTSRTLELEEQTRRDPMTGVYNRAYLDHFLRREFDNSTRHKWPLSIAFADLDNFKTINDTFGHQAGDGVLRAAARILRGNTRETDVVARYGGEEFLVVLPATDAATAQALCERIVAAFENTLHPVGSAPTKVTISIGCATHGGNGCFASAAAFIEAADRALYEAKLKGRNRAVPFEGGTVAPGVAAAAGAA